jgi:2,4-dienoyl-CoA reductase-like NADH-dependent reductase (Old Yellow Enzyme family)
LPIADLFTPFTLNGLKLANRIVMAPMTRNFSPNGVPGDNVAAYYRRRAEGEIGLILTEGTSPNAPEAQNLPNIPHMYGDDALAGWKHVVDGVHAAGTFFRSYGTWAPCRARRIRNCPPRRGAPPDF